MVKAMSTAVLRLASRITEDVVWREGYIPLFGGQRYRISALAKMERTWKNQIELTVTTVMGTSFKVRMAPHEKIIDIKRRIFYREGIPVEKQHLIWNSVELEDSVKISDYKLTSESNVQLVTAMRGGPLNIRRVPMMDENQLIQRMQFASDDMNGSRGGRPIAVIVLQDGTELHFFQFIDSDDELSDDEENDEESDIKSTDAPEIRERKEANVRTRTTMANLRQRMEQTKLNKKAKAAVPSRRTPTKSPVGKPSPSPKSPTINRGSSTKLPGANIPIVIGHSAINATRSSTTQNKDGKKTKDGNSASSLKRNSNSSQNQNRNDQGNDSQLDGGSSSSIWARLLASTSKFSELEASNFSLGGVIANRPGIPVDNMATPTDESSYSSIWLRRVHGRDEVVRTSSGKLPTYGSKQSTHSSTIIKGRANKNTAASGVIRRNSPTAINDRCSYCTKKLRLAGSFQCRCGGTFCALHRYPETHHCQHDYKTKGRQILARDNPRVVADKFPKI